MAAPIDQAMSACHSPPRSGFWGLLVGLGESVSHCGAVSGSSHRSGGSCLFWCPGVLWHCWLVVWLAGWPFGWLLVWLAGQVPPSALVSIVQQPLSDSHVRVSLMLYAVHVLAVVGDNMFWVAHLKLHQWWKLT